MIRWKREPGAAGTDDKRERHSMGRMHEHGSRYVEFHRPSVEVLFNLDYAYGVIHTHLARKIEAQGLSLGAFNLLLILSRCEAGCPMHELGELLLVSRANVTGLVDCLARRGLAERAPDVRDRRVRLVRLTRAGAQLLEALLPAHYARVHDMFKGMSDRDKAALSEQLARLRRSVQQTLAQGFVWRNGNGGTF